MSEENSLYSGTLFADVIWKIENFHSRSLEVFHSLQSEEFIVDSNLSFKLRCEEMHLVNLNIWVPNGKKRPAQTQLRYELFMLDTAGLIKKEFTSRFFDYRNFSSTINTLRLDTSEVENVLTIRCKMYWAQACKTQVSRYYLHTFDWCIDNFLKSSCKESSREVHFKSLKDSKKSNKLKICYRANENKLTFTTEDTDDFYISKCIIKVPMTDKYFLNHRNALKVPSKKDSVPEFEPLISRQELINKYWFNGRLTLNCLLLISNFNLNLQDEPSALTSENQNGSESLKNKQIKILEDNAKSNVRLNAEILKMYQEGLMSDFVVKVDTREFQTHMCVLSARSPVIRRMLETDMKEKQERKLIIQNMQEDTVQRMLDYIYTDNPGKLDLDSASKLYSAANMYDLAGPKHDCKIFLKQNMSISNVCEILLLGELHGDQELKSSAIGFVAEHEEQVVLCKEFEDFSKKNPQLSVDVLLGVARLRMKKS